MGALRNWLLRYFRENCKELLEFDMHVARVLGAPAPHTLSSWSYQRQNVAPFWGLFRRITDFLALKLFKQVDHCRKAWEAMQPK